MPWRYLLLPWVTLALSITSVGCKLEDKRRENGMPQEPSAIPNGEVHLTREQVRLNQIVTTAVIEEKVTYSLLAIGRIRARAGGEARVYSPFAGKLVADPTNLPRVGDLVGKGQILAEVEQVFNAAEKLQVAAATTQLQASVQQAQHELQFRQAELDRTKQLYEVGAIPLKQLQAAELVWKQTQTQLVAAQSTQTQYERASAPNAAPRREAIRAPITGTIVAADLTAGSQIDSSTSLLTIVELSIVWVEVSVHESDLRSIRQARESQIFTRANPGQIYRGKLVTVGNLVDPANRTITVTFAVRNPDTSLKIGMYAEARIPTVDQIKGLTIPSSSVLADETQSFVFVESQPGIFARRTIVPGEQTHEKIVVKSGLKAGEMVVSRGAQVLRGESSRSQIPADND